VELVDVVPALHAAACCVTLAYAYACRRSVERREALAVALVWCVGFLVLLLSDVVVGALPPPSNVPLSGIRNRTLLAVDGALYFASPLGLATWVRWTFVRARPLAMLIPWVLAFGVPTVVYPAIRGELWFRYAAIVQIFALSVSFVAIAQWVRRIERPRPWHILAFAATLFCNIPIIPFLASPDVRPDYVIWVVRAFIALHLGVIAILGGDLWGRSSSSR
jgi:hypothetical protein